MSEPNFLITEYEAAVLVGLSPQLLRWLTKYAPKQGEDRKLKAVQKIGPFLYFAKAEILVFNEWLKAPWPQKEGKRPPIPSGIREEIRREAGGGCAICQGFSGACEAAHIDPVSKSKNNHPENLIWLCANHHTSYDKNFFGPTEEDREFVRSFKLALHNHNKMGWRVLENSHNKLMAVFAQCENVLDEFQKAKTLPQFEAVSRLAGRALFDLSNEMFHSSLLKANDKVAQKLWKAHFEGESSKDEVPTEERLKAARNLRVEYAAARGYVKCPLCNATGRHGEYDCPICLGEREVDAQFAREVDLAPYKKVSCPLCKGTGKHHGDDCPACGGDISMDRHYADRIDLSQYDTVPCPLCKGTGRHHGDDCPACHGDRSMDRHYADRIDLSQYDTVPCPLCRGTGRHHGDDCPACHGDRNMDRRYAEQLDLRQYEEITCPACKGRGRYRGEDCGFCDSEGKVSRNRAEKFDF